MISAHSQIAQGHLHDHYLSSFLERRLAHFKRKTFSDDVWVVAPLDVHVGPREGRDFICYR